ncbi:hypothetical protein Ethha_0923 [Ethanoligenens harbinense YUAN-3]|uniref:Uncharacterized protein n=1 Tax=Ethanoligenens harbinense (strain DSM 18485 / JCM 12961 / CGMCC 1.5033 / YUAN-3) TaxID=663278 RepID=E6U3R5_ETHHY|nr:hypothetical protein Ethha_0923 [Ethanoligenens harbinense YUAN-3]
MQIECAYCSNVTDQIPYCNAPLCAACCRKCRKMNGGCPLLRLEEQERTRRELRTG